MRRSYTFGGDTGLTQEEINQRRRIAQQLFAARGSAPKNVGEGLHSIGQAIAGAMQMKRAREGQLELNKLMEDHYQTDLAAFEAEQAAAAAEAAAARQAAAGRAAAEREAGSSAWSERLGQELQGRGAQEGRRPAASPGLAFPGRRNYTTPANMQQPFIFPPGVKR